MANLFYILILLVGFPVGYFLAWLAKDELVAGRKWFFLLAFVSLVSAVVVSFTDFYLRFTIILSLFFIIILCLLAAWKSYDKSFLLGKETLERKMN